MQGRSQRPKWDRVRSGMAGAAAVCAAVTLVLSQLPASAQMIADPATPVIGNATYFDGLGAPYGGCGLPQAQLESQNFVALNVYNTPGDYSFYPRPLTGANAGKVGAWNNGLNCGRWVQVKISDYCTGVNDGAPNQPFCRNGSWGADRYNNAVLNMLVTDSCGDANGWCRDDPYHLDLSKDSLNRFVGDGGAVGDVYPSHWNNRRVAWSFIPAPDYTGDVQIGFMQGAKVYWPAIAVSHLANGIHGVEYLAGGAWQTAKMNGDMGQSYIIDGATPGSSQFHIRIRDVNDELINNGRVYSFSLPASCGSACGQAYTGVAYTTNGPTTAPSTPTTTPPPTTTPTTTPATTPPPTTAPTTTPTTTPSSGACGATSTIANAWSGGFQSTVTVTAGNAPVSGWTVTWTFVNGERISQLWNAAFSSTGSTVTARNLGWNGSLAANGSTSFGYNGAGVPKAVAVTCTSP